MHLRAKSYASAAPDTTELECVSIVRVDTGIAVCLNSRQRSNLVRPMLDIPHYFLRALCHEY
jgi:hypothetical protein